MNRVIWNVDIAFLYEINKYDIVHMYVYTMPYAVQYSLITAVFFLIPGHIIVTCLPPISTQGLTKADMPDLMEDVRAQMMEVYTKTSSQVRLKCIVCIYISEVPYYYC